MAPSPLLVEKPNPFFSSVADVPCPVSLQSDMSGLAGNKGTWPARHRLGESVGAYWPRSWTLLAGWQVSLEAVGRRAAAFPRLADHLGQ